MAEPTREEKARALRRCIKWREEMERNWRGTALGEGAKADAAALRAVLRELEAGGWRPTDAIFEAASKAALAEFCQPNISVAWSELQPAAKIKWLRIGRAAVQAAIDAPPSTSDGGK